jgi:molecular chaperone HscA
VRAVVRDAKAARDDIDGIVLVGGATRMPLVRQAVHDFFGRAPLTNLDPDQVVAIGAARQADALAGNVGAATCCSSTSCRLARHRDVGGLVERSSSATGRSRAARAQASRPSGRADGDGDPRRPERARPGRRLPLRSHFELHGIPPMVAGAANQVPSPSTQTACSASRARRDLGREASVTVKPSYGLSDEEVTRMLGEGFGHAEDDMAARALREAQVEADRLLAALASALAADGELLSFAERTQIEGRIDVLRSARAESDRAAIDNALHALSDATEAFAAERMNRGIRRALAGRRVEDL